MSHPTHEARHRARFLCQLAGADQKQPLGVFSNLPGLQRDLLVGWPTFSRVKELLVYTGPLPKTCPCKTAHPPMVGVSDHSSITSANVLLGTGFWRRIFCGNLVEYRIPLLYGWGKAQDAFCTLGQRLFLCRCFIVLLVFRLPFLGNLESFHWASFVNFPEAVVLESSFQFLRETTSGGFRGLRCSTTARSPLRLALAHHQVPLHVHGSLTWQLLRSSHRFGLHALLVYAVRCRLRRAHLRAQAALRNHP